MTREPPIILAIETSCDETAVAVLAGGRDLLASEIASQAAMHAQYGGVVPEVASRSHLTQLQPLIARALASAQLDIEKIDAFAATSGPGLATSLMVGASAAKGLSISLRKPFLAVNHLEGHLLSPFFGKEIRPCVGLVVSGGHTLLVEIEAPGRYRLLGQTHDDAAGEAFDKVAAMLGLGFPGGPALEREARNGNPKAFAFPRSFADNDRLEFSFSGVKTSVLYACHGYNVSKGTPPPSGQKRADLAASFQEAVVDVLAIKCAQAIRKSKFKRLAVGGGVSANLRLRQKLEEMAEKEGVELFIPPLNLCTDNAAMAALAVEKWKLGEFAAEDLDAEPNFA